MTDSTLYDEATFYQSFIKDLENCNKEVIIESPYITTERMRIFTPVFKNLLERKVKIYIMTRDPKEHIESMENTIRIYNSTM